MNKVNKYIANQRKLLAKLKKAHDTAIKASDAANKAARKTGLRYDNTQHDTIVKIAKMKGFDYYEAMRLLNQGSRKK